MEHGIYITENVQISNYIDTAGNHTLMEPHIAHNTVGV